MAKHNFVILNGQVLQEPRISRDSETGEYIRGIGAILTIRGIRDFGNNIDHLKYDSPLIMSGNPEMIKIMATWHKGDMVEIKGAVTTKDVTKSVTCKECGHKNKKKGNVVFVNPIYICVRETGVDEETGQRLLKERCEISNQATLIGPVCREPKTFRTNKGLMITTYQLAVRRKYRIKDDSADIRTDFPWIKSYGNIAINDAKTLKKGSYIFVDGMLQTRELERIQICEKCGTECKWHDSAMEIVPYATEYLRDFYTKEEIEKREAEEGRLAAEQVLNEQEIDSVLPMDDPFIEEEQNDE